MAGKSVTFNVRVPEDVARAMDEARAGQSRSSWVAGVIDAALAGMAVCPKCGTAGCLEDAKPGGSPVESRSKSEKKRVEALGRCTHPRVRVLKGFCYACGMSASV